MFDLMDRKIRQMHAALRALGSVDLSAITVEVTKIEGDTYTSVDFNRNSDPIKLANAAGQLVENIASIKDHLKYWCVDNHIKFTGEDLINSNRSVALIHDLWNVNKHARLNRPPRSGITPKLANIETALSISAGTEDGSAAIFSMDPLTGVMEHETSGDGSIQLVLCAEIVDDKGKLQGYFTQICSEAIDAWMTEMSKAGVPMPKA
jgi:hypothetical protein